MNVTTFTYSDNSSTTSLDTILRTTSYVIPSNKTLISVDIDGNVTSLYANCFQNSGLTSITIPSAVISIGDDCFADCAELLTMSLTNGIVNLSTRCFKNCPKLTSISIPSSVISLGESCFQDCIGLLSANLISTTVLDVLNTSCFQGCSVLTSITIPSAVTVLGDSCFQDCTELTIVNLTSANSLNSLNTSCFQSCTKLPSITIPSSVTVLGESCFQNCYVLSSITIPSTVYNLGNSCFANCGSLTTVSIPAVTTLSDHCFQGSGLVNIILPSTVTSLGIECFLSCTGLRNIIIPSYVTNIGDNCFTTCSGLISITYENPSNINSVGSVITDTSNITVNFYQTSSTPSTGVYNTSKYTGSNNNFNYYTGIYVSCYNEGTLVLVYKNGIEEYVKIENLRKGDLVKTLGSGYKLIELIGKHTIVNGQGNKYMQMYQYNDLIVTGKHLMLVDSINGKYKKRGMIEGKYCILACNDERFKRIINNNKYTVYHLVLKGHKKQYGIYVNDGVLSETASKEHFLNHSFTQLVE